MIPKYIYHYTTLDTLFAILGSHDMNEKTLQLRATCIYELNDPSEMEVGIESIIRHVKEIEDKKRDMAIPSLSAILKDPKDNDAFIKLLFSKRHYRGINIATTPYISSFTTLRDSLPMWSLYANKGKGICLKINLLEMFKNDCDFMLGNVVYGERKPNELVKDIIEKAYDFEISDLQRKSDTNANDLIESFSNIVLSISPFLNTRVINMRKNSD